MGAVALLDRALRVSRVANDYSADWWYWQWFVAGVRDSQNHPDGYEWFAEDGLAADGVDRSEAAFWGSVDSTPFIVNIEAQPLSWLGSSWFRANFYPPNPLLM